MAFGSFRGKAANLAATALAAGLLGAAPSGALYVTSLPAGADVWVDGTYLGRAPVVDDGMAAGEHHVTLSLTGWTTQDLGVTVVPDTTATASVVLVRALGADAVDAGSIALHGAWVGRVVLDGETVTVGNDGSFAAPAGTHELAVQVAAGRITRSVTVYPHTRTDVVLRADAETRSVVIAPADDYVPAAAIDLRGTRLVIRYGGHEVVATIGSATYAVDGRSVTYDAAPTMIKQRLYLPIELLSLVTGTKD